MLVIVCRSEPLRSLLVAHAFRLEGLVVKEANYFLNGRELVYQRHAQADPGEEVGTIANLDVKQNLPGHP